MTVKSYQDLIVWQKAMKLGETVYALVKLLPAEERYALSDQMRRAAVSIPSNIAEGQARISTKEFIQFLSVARGSNAELMTQTLFCERLGYMTAEQTQEVKVLINEIGKMLTSLILTLKRTL